MEKRARTPILGVVSILDVARILGVAPILGVAKILSVVLILGVPRILGARCAGSVLVEESKALLRPKRCSSHALGAASELRVRES